VVATPTHEHLDYNQALFRFGNWFYFEMDCNQIGVAYAGYLGHEEWDDEQAVVEIAEFLAMDAVGSC
jgi:hypothetical protein